MITISCMRKAPRRSASSPRDKIGSRETFGKRFNQLCDEQGIPPKGKNRQKIVGIRFSVTQQGARKWLEGEGFPEMEKAIEIAISFNVCVEWLLTGRGPKRVAQKPALAFSREEVEAIRTAAEKASAYVVE
jgi:hypothetical protein